MLGLSALIVTLAASVVPASGTEQPVPTVRPGGWVSHSPTGAGGNCTAGFLFEGNDGYRYLFMGGHCITRELSVEPSGARFYAPGEVPLYDPISRREIGYAVYTLNTYRLEGQHRVRDPQHPDRMSPVGADFGLVRLHPHVRAIPEMCFWGGPTGINRDLSPDPVVIRMYNSGMTGRLSFERAGLDEPRVRTLPAKTGIATHLRHPDFAHFSSLAGSGDSGSPIISEDGRALGVLNLGAVMVQDGITSAGPLYIIRVGTAIDWMERQLDIEFELMKADLRNHPQATVVGRGDC